MKENRAKIVVVHVKNVKFLGYGFYINKDKGFTSGSYQKHYQHEREIIFSLVEEMAGVMKDGKSYLGSISQDGLTISD